MSIIYLALLLFRAKAHTQLQLLRVTKIIIVEDMILVILSTT